MERIKKYFRKPLDNIKTKSVLFYRHLQYVTMRTSQPCTTWSYRHSMHTFVDSITAEHSTYFYWNSSDGRFKVINIGRHSKTERGTNPWKYLYNHCLDRRLRVGATCIFVRNCSHRYNVRYVVFYFNDIIKMNTIHWCRNIIRKKTYEQTSWWTACSKCWVFTMARILPELLAAQ